MKKNAVFVVLALLLVLAACAPKASVPFSLGAPDEVRAPGYDSLAQEAPVADAYNEGMTQPNEMPYGQSGTENSTTAIQERLVIMNAELSIVVSDPDIKVDAIARMANQMGGFVVSMNIYQTYAPRGEVVLEGRISIRVPATSMDNAINQIKGDAIEVRNETRSGQDVTQQYVDLESRLRSMESARDQLEQIMLNATETEDVLSVFNQLEYYREQIEVVKGQMQYFEEASAYSLITVTVIAEETIQPLEIGGWKPEGVARDAVQALIQFLQSLVDFLIWLVILVLPILLIIFGPFVLVGLGIRSAIRKRKAKKAKA